MCFPANPVLLRAGADDTVDDALRYDTGVVGDRTPRALQETYVRSGAPLIGYLETDDQLPFQRCRGPTTSRARPRPAPTACAISRPRPPADEPYDRAFSGGAPPLYPIERAPLLAAAFGVSDLGAKGGLRTDTSARVLDIHGRPIPGLYAAGNTMAAPSDAVYPGGGNPIGTSMVFSHLAVRDMLTR